MNVYLKDPQWSVFCWDRRFRVLVAGRRFGKTFLARTELCRAAWGPGRTSNRTLRKHFREELNHGATEANSQMAHALFKKAKDGHTTAQIFWLECCAGWRERDGFEGATPAVAPFVVAREKES